MAKRPCGRGLWVTPVERASVLLVLELLMGGGFEQLEDFRLILPTLEDVYLQPGGGVATCSSMIGENPEGGRCSTKSRATWSTPGGLVTGGSRPLVAGICRPGVRAVGQHAQRVVLRSHRRPAFTFGATGFLCMSGTAVDPAAGLCVTAGNATVSLVMGPMQSLFNDLAWGR